MPTGTRTRAKSLAVPDSIRHAKKRKFIEAFAELGVIKYAAKEAGIHRDTYYDWIENDHEFARAVTVAAEDAADSLEEALYERGVTGWLEPVYHQGDVVGHVRRFSDACLIFASKAARPAKFRERYDIAVSGEVTHTFDADSIDSLAGRFSAARERAQAIETTATEET